MTKENKFKIGLCLQEIALSMDDVTLEKNRERLKLIEDIIAGEQEPCSDAISRQWLMRKAIERFYTTNYFNHITKMIEEAPSVTPKEPKIGHWIPLGNYDDWGNESSYKCSECGELDTYTDNFCPNCGADMRGDVK